jgi:uncharacterized phosphosugar-binding protein
MSRVRRWRWRGLPQASLGSETTIEVADLVLDTCGEPGDALVSIEGSPAKAGLGSTIAGAVLVDSMMVEGHGIAGQERCHSRHSAQQQQ